MLGLDCLLEAWKDAQPMTQPGIFLIPRPLFELVGAWNEAEQLMVTPFDDFIFFDRILFILEDVLFTLGAVLYCRSGL